jgi:hypothetical protein
MAENSRILENETLQNRISGNINRRQLSEQENSGEATDLR